MEYKSIKEKNRLYMREYRERVETEDVIIIGAIRDLNRVTSRDEFADICVRALDELGYDVGQLWDIVKEN